MPAQLEYQRTRVLITVKTYPHPSKGSVEVVCCAGVTDSYDMVRIYPVDFRYRDKQQQFSKYQWIEVDLAPRPRNKDWRKESRQPLLHTLKLLDEVGTGKKHDWLERRKVVDRVQDHTVLELMGLYDADRTSLGIVRPMEVLDLEVEKCSAKWSPKHRAVLSQPNLFDNKPKPLQKIPYTFKYVFRCGDDQEPHHCTITDWELGMLFLNQRIRHDETTAIRHVKEQFLDHMCAPDRDTRFFMGTMLPRNDWLVLGVFRPPKLPKLTSPRKRDSA